MSADKQIIRNWRFWAGVLAGAALMVILLSLIGRLDFSEAPASDSSNTAARQ